MSSFKWNRMKHYLIKDTADVSVKYLQIINIESLISINI